MKKLGSTATRARSTSPLRNRVTPFGAIVAVDARGLMMGNRGVLHDASQQIVRDWQLRRWIACRLEFRGRYRAVMQPGLYTELFFLDEATAFAAGHRPCAECRNADYRRFRSLWSGDGGSSARADAIDAQLHAERLDGSTKRTYRTELGSLPDGTFVTLEERAWLVWNGELRAWSPSGYDSRRAYDQRRSAKGSREVEVLTPRSIVAVLAGGYVPAVHPSGF